MLLSGCSGSGEPTAENVTSAPSVATASQASQTPSSAATSAAATPGPAATGDVIKAYVDAFASDSDPDAMREGLKSATPGSPAYIYLSHLANVSEAGLDGGQALADQEVTPVGSDGFKVCSDPSDDKSCVTIGGFKVNEKGLLADLTINKKPIASRLTTGNGDSVTAAGAKFTFLTAYKSVQSNALFVTVKVKTGSKAISPNLYSATYRSPSGKQRQAQDAYGPTDIDADSNTIVSMAFPGVEPGGRVKIEGCVGTECSGIFDLVIKVG
jgi:hypothetical protein